MKYSLFLASCLASVSCASAPPPVISAQQVRAFEDVVREAEAAGATDNESKAGALLRDAKADFYYAEHLPSDPDRARDVSYKAFAKAETALGLARSNQPRDVASRTATEERLAPDPSTAAPMTGDRLVAAPTTPAPNGN